MWSRRPIAAGLSLIAGALIVGCGSDEGADVSVDPVAADEITAKLDLVQERFSEADCAGAGEALASLQEDVPNVNANEQFREDLATLLEDLSEQIESECSAGEDTTSTTTTTEDEETTTSDTTEEHTTESSTSTEKDTTSSSTTTEETTTEPPPEEEVPPPGQGGTPPGQGGVPPGQEGESGGVGPGFESDGRVLP